MFVHENPHAVLHILSNINKHVADLRKIRYTEGNKATLFAIQIYYMIDIPPLLKVVLDSHSPLDDLLHNNLVSACVLTAEVVFSEATAQE